MQSTSNVPILRRRLSILGRGMLVYIFSANLFGTLMLIPQTLFPALLENRDIYTMAVNAVACYAVAPAVLWLMVRKLPTARGKQPLSFRAWLRLLILCVGMLFFFAILTDAFISLLELITGRQTQSLLEVAAGDIPTPIFLIFSVILAPLGEELVFRRILLDRLRPFGEGVAILLTALAFALFHGNLYQMFYSFSIGLVLGAVVIKTGRLRHAILLHAGVNLISSLLSEAVNAGNWGVWLYYFVLLVTVTLGILFLRWYAPSFHCDGPLYPVSRQEVARAARSTLSLWVYALITLLSSLLVIFVL